MWDLEEEQAAEEDKKFFYYVWIIINKNELFNIYLFFVI